MSIEMTQHDDSLTIRVEVGAFRKVIRVEQQLVRVSGRLVERWVVVGRSQHLYEHTAWRLAFAHARACERAWLRAPKRAAA